MAPSVDPDQDTNLDSLQPGMELEGTVTRTELYGAFLDVGLEREGFIHISMLRRSKVNKVEDVVRANDTVQAWVHRVDPHAGRLELTLIKPFQLKWRDIKPGDRLPGKVVRLEKFGAFVDIGAERPGLVHISELSTEYVSQPSDIVKVGDSVEVSVLDVEVRKRQISLSMKAGAEEEVQEAEEESVAEKIPTAMELALRKALNGTSDDHRHPEEGNPRLEARKEREDQEDLLSRTLAKRMKTSRSEDETTPSSGDGS